MANLYGVASPVFYPGILQLTASDVVCTHDTFTAVLTTPALVAPSNGYFYAMVWATLMVNFGATLPTGINAALAIGGGSYGTQFGVSPFGLLASSYNSFTFTLLSSISQTAWQGAGSTITLGFNPAIQNATIKQYSSMVYALFRAPDQ